MVFFTSDLHLGHRKIIQYCNRPFANVKEMDEALIANWNRVVKPEDTIHVAGDVAFCCDMEYALSIMKQLNGKIKHLIPGNHDALALEMNNVRPGTWASIDKMPEIIVNNQRIVICHYPLATWHWSYKGVWMLYGHVHGTMKMSGKSIDIGVDCHNYTPLSFWDLKKIMDGLPNIHTIPKDKEWDKSDRNE